MTEPSSSPGESQEPAHPAGRPSSRAAGRAGRAGFGVGGRRRLLGRTTAALATSLIPTTLTLALVHGSASALGLVLAAEFVPMLLLLPVAGVFADRFPARRVIMLADLTRAAAQAGIGVELLAAGLNVPRSSPPSPPSPAPRSPSAPRRSHPGIATVPGPSDNASTPGCRCGRALAQFAGPGIAGTLMLGIGAGWSSLLTAAAVHRIGADARRHGRTGARRRRAPAIPAAGQPPRRAHRPALPADARAPFVAELRGGWAETRRHPLVHRQRPRPRRVAPGRRVPAHPRAGHRDQAPRRRHRLGHHPANRHRRHARRSLGRRAPAPAAP